MRPLFAFLLIAFFPIAGLASDIVRCDPNDADVPNRVITYERSVSTLQAWFTDPTIIVNPNISAVAAITVRYWKCIDTDADAKVDAVVEMTSSEKTAIDAPIVARNVDVQRIATLRDELDLLGNDWSSLTTVQQQDALKKLFEMWFLERKLGG